MKDRIEKILEDEQLSASKFADSIGVQRSSISHILSGRNKPSLELINKILDHFSHINADWLLLGKGNMTNKGNNQGPVLKPGITTSFELPTSGNQGEKPTARTPVKVLFFYADGTFEEYHPSILR